MNIEKFKRIQSIDELKQLGTVEEIKKVLNKIITPLQIKASSYKELFDSLKILQEKHIDFINSPFKSKQDEYLFYLTQLEGGQRNKLLGLTDKHYEDKQLAKKWYKQISNYVHPDKIHSYKDGKNKAFNILTNIYNVLIEEDES